LQVNVEQTFPGHRALFKAQYYHPWVNSDDGVMCPTLLDGWKLDKHASFFVVTMKSNCNFAKLPPFNCNSTFWLWQRLDPMAL
jgi:hypothetical protein